MDKEGAQRVQNAIGQTGRLFGSPREGQRARYIEVRTIDISTTLNLLGHYGLMHMESVSQDNRPPSHPVLKLLSSHQNRGLLPHSLILEDVNETAI